MMRRAVIITALVAGLLASAVALLAGPAGAAELVPQRTCPAHTYASWKLTKTHRLRAVCLGAKPLAFGVNYGAGMAYAPQCPHGTKAKLDAVGPAQDRAGATCEVTR